MYLVLYDDENGEANSKTFDSVEDIQVWLGKREPYTIVDTPPAIYEGAWESRYEGEAPGSDVFGVYITKIEAVSLEPQGEALKGPKDGD